MLTPDEIEQIKPRRAFVGGFKRDKTRELLRQIAADFRRALDDRVSIEEETHRMRADLGRRERRDVIESSTLMAARQAALRIREEAREDAELILRKAYKRAGEIRRAADRERDARAGELQQLERQSELIRMELRTVLRSVLRALDERAAETSRDRPPAAETKRETQPPVTQDLERAVRDLVVRIQRKPGPRVEADGAEQSETSAVGSEATAEGQDDPVDGERPADESVAS